MKSPTALTLERLERGGFLCDVVERRITRIVTKDLFGILDIVAVKEGETFGVQCTSRSNVSARVRKIKASPHLSRLREAGWRILVHGWDKGPDKQPRLRVVVVE